jgi:S-(hydroxymethyl)glutathione dehydrogenase/alcohol dehydrogenase
MTGVGSVTNVAQVQAGELVVVLGVGGVGLSVVQGARLAGAGAIVAIDLNPERLQMAQRFGAHHLLQADPGDEGLLQAARRVRELLGRGADFAFECTAVPALAAAPLAMVCNGGMAVAVSGFEEVVPVDLRLFEFDKTFINPLYGRCNPEVDFPRLLTLYHAGELLLDEMVTRTYPLTDGGLRAAIDDLQQARNAKGVLLPAQPA